MQDRTPDGFPSGSRLPTVLFKSDPRGVRGSGVSRRLAVLGTGHVCRRAWARAGALVAGGDSGGARL